MKTHLRILFLSLLLLQCSCAPAQRIERTPQLPDELQSLYSRIDSLSEPLVRQKPLIGITTYGDSGPGDYDSPESKIGMNYVQSIIKAGGTPYLIPLTEDAELLRDIASRLDGIIFPGGEDISPAFYGAAEDPKLEATNLRRDVFELTLLKLVTDRNIPVLGVCRGLQLINVGFGGTLYQDIPSNHPSEVNHRPRNWEKVHKVSLASGSKAEEILGGMTELEVNSYHHQGICKLGFGLRVTGWSPDSIPEIIEGYPDRPIFAVQFHPEVFASQGDTTFLKLFRFLTDKAETYRKAKEIHSRVISVDTHTDAPLWFKRGAALDKRGKSQVCLQKMDEGRLDAQFLAAFIGQGKRDDASLRGAVDKVNGIIENARREVERCGLYCGLADNAEDILRLKSEGKKAFFIGIENGYAIGKDITNIERYKKLGVKYMTLCHSHDNDICHSSTHTDDATKGLTAFGREVVREMNRVGMMIDLSHASEGTFWEVLSLSTKPVICSHSSSRALCDHNRNLTDRQLRAIAEKGGVVQVCLYDSYISKSRADACLDDAVRHIEHIVEVAGIDHVGIGSDFDGGGGLNGLNGDNDLINITVRLLEDGFTEEDLRKLWGGNFFRVMTEVERL